MTVELTDEQFDRLLNTLGEARADLITTLNDLRLDLEQRLDELKIGQGLLHTAANVIEEDVGKIQATLREHTQALDGITELSKTNFDLIESLNKHIHGESSTLSHADRAIRGTQPQ
jgi:ABC-type transporter Mla subunit MlaD